jgi:DNA-binding CsgD family transcriptional regulator
MHSLDFSGTEPLSGAEDAFWPFWSPDSRFVAFFTGVTGAAPPKIKKVGVAGGPVETICDLPPGTWFWGAWNQDGVILFGCGGEPPHTQITNGELSSIPNVQTSTVSSIAAGVMVHRLHSGPSRRQNLLTSPLTEREKQIVRFVAKHRSSKEIAALLKITPKTVELHRKAIMAKLGVKGTAGLVRYAIKAGLIEP